MAQQPRIYSRELVQQVGVVRIPAPDLSGIDVLVDGVQRYADRASAEEKKQRLYEVRREGFAAAMQRDKDGNLMPQPLREPTDDEARAYNTAYEQGLFSGYENDIRRRATEFRNASGDNSKIFATQFDAYAETVLSKMPEDFRAQISSIAEGVGTQTNNAIMGVERAREYNLANSEWTETLQHRRNDVTAMAEGGMTGTEEYTAAFNEYKARVDAGVAAGFITEDQARIKFELLADEGEALAISNMALEAYEAAGGGAAGLRAGQNAIDNILDDPSLKVDGPRRRQIARTAQERINREEMLRNADRIEANRREDEVRKAMEAERAATQNDFLERLVSPNDENGGPLTTKDVLGSKLDAFGKGSKQTFMELIDKKASGTDINRTNPTVFNSLFSAVQQGRITVSADLLPFVGNGISPSDYRSLQRDIEDIRAPEMKVLAAVKKDFFAAAKSRITGSTLIRNDTRGDEKFYEFKRAFDQSFTRKVEAGADPMDLLDPTHKDYMGGMVNGFVRSPQQQLQDQADDMRRWSDTRAEVPEASGGNTPVRPPISEAMGDELKSILKSFGFTGAEDN